MKGGWPEDDQPWREIVGIAGDVKLQGVDQATPLHDNAFKVPLARNLLVRTLGEVTSR